ncbi:F-box LRR-repeat protein [Dimargaris xerosporica]|nr:F-box LRR-repeat protein [Dimargaris xerosporica]
MPPPTMSSNPAATNTVVSLIPDNVWNWLAALPWTRPLLTQLANAHTGLHGPQELWAQALSWLPQRLYYDEVGLPTHWSFIDHGRHIRKLDFSGGQALVTDQTLGVVAATCSALTHLSLSGCTAVTAAGLAEIATHCAGLRAVVLDDCPAVQDECIERLALSCNTPGLQTLSLANATRITDRSLRALATHQPKLAKLSLPGCRGVHSRGIQMLVERCRALVWLDISSIPDVDHATVTKVANQCSQLERLNLAYAGKRHYQLPPSAVPSNLATASTNGSIAASLLMLPRQIAINDQTVGYVVQHSAKLQVLNLDYLPTLTNQAIRYITSHGDALVSISFVGCPQIDQRALVMLAQLRDRTGQLVSLTLGDSPLITEETVNVLTRGPAMVTQGWQRTIIQDHALPRYLRTNFWAR